MMYNCGTFYIDGGFRPAIAKKGHKWAYLMYLRANSVKCKKIRNQKTGVPKSIGGMKSYPLQDLAQAFLNKSVLTGTDRKMSKKTKAMLMEARGRK